MLKLQHSICMSVHLNDKRQMDPPLIFSFIKRMRVWLIHCRLTPSGCWYTTNHSRKNGKLRQTSRLYKCPNLGRTREQTRVLCGWKTKMLPTAPTFCSVDEWLSKNIQVSMALKPVNCDADAVLLPSELWSHNWKSRLFFHCASQLFQVNYLSFSRTKL